MANLIVYQLPGQPVSLVNPCVCGLTLEQIGKKDVPAAVPFWIVDASSIQAEPGMRNAWELDMQQLGKPSGYGAAKE